jgi:hypothetical protein
MSYSDKRARQWIFVVFNFSGKQGKDIRHYLFLKDLHNIDVWTNDIQDTVMDDTRPFHKKGDFKKVLDELTEEYGKPPIAIVGNPPCTYNTYLCSLNHPVLGKPTSDDEERVNQKTKYLKEAAYELLVNSGALAVILENPKGYFDTVITRKNGDETYEAFQPWHFFGHNGTYDEEDLHTKETHLHSGGVQAAIDMYPLSEYITQHEKPPNVIDNWVLTRVSSNERSWSPTGMSMAIADCITDRLAYCLRSKTRKKPLEIVFNYSEINPRHKIGTNSPCNNFIGMYKGKPCACNLPLGHQTEKNMIRGVHVCGLMDHETGEYIFKAPTVSHEKRVSMYRTPTLRCDDEERDTTDTTQHDKSVPRRPYLCGICKKPKKGHACIVAKDKTEKPVAKPVSTTLAAPRRPYLCGICNKPKKGHVCVVAKDKTEKPVAEPVAKTPPVPRRPYLCGICKKPKKGHVCVVFAKD